MKEKKIEPFEVFLAASPQWLPLERESVVVFYMCTMRRLVEDKRMSACGVATTIESTLFAFDLQ